MASTVTEPQYMGRLFKDRSLNCQETSTKAPSSLCSPPFIVWTDNVRTLQQNSASGLSHICSWYVGRSPSPEGRVDPLQYVLLTERRCHRQSKQWCKNTAYCMLHQLLAMRNSRHNDDRRAPVNNLKKKLSSNIISVSEPRCLFSVTASLGPRFCRSSQPTCVPFLDASWHIATHFRFVFKALSPFCDSKDRLLCFRWNAVLITGFSVCMCSDLHLRLCDISVIFFRRCRAFYKSTFR